MPKAKAHSTTARPVERQTSAIHRNLAVVVAQGRPTVEAAIEALIACLDEAEADPDLEPDDHDGCPFEDANRSNAPEEPGDADDAEPSLGSVEPYQTSVYGNWSIGQLNWSAGGIRDLERDDCDSEQDFDREFSAQPTIGTLGSALTNREIEALEATIVSESTRKLGRRPQDARKNRSRNAP